MRDDSWSCWGAEKHEEFLPEIVTTLCFIGSPVAAEPLIDFVKSARAGRAVFKAKHAALIHLGDLIKKSGNQQRSTSSPTSRRTWVRREVSPGPKLQ